MPRKRKKTTKTCPICKIKFEPEFEHQVSCTKPCAEKRHESQRADYHERRRKDKAEIPPRPCDVCQTLFKREASHHRKFCSDECALLRQQQQLKALAERRKAEVAKRRAEWDRAEQEKVLVPSKDIPHGETRLASQTDEEESRQATPSVRGSAREGPLP